MSRRAVQIEDDFDDETELPLPKRPLPNTGTRGALLRSVDDDDGDEEDEEDLDLDEMDNNAFNNNGFIPFNMNSNNARPGPATPSSQQQQFFPTGPDAHAHPAAKEADNVVSDLTPYKKWTCIYPIYLDAKRAYGTGERRIARQKAIWFPLSKDIADATNRLGLSTLHEVQKCHPRDWENPGRVRVQWKKDGRLANPRITSKKQLLEMIAAHIQQVKPEMIPKPPFSTVTNEPPLTTPSKPQPAPKSKASVIKSKSNAKQSSGPSTGPSPRQARLPIPPASLSGPASRLSPYSPAVPTGMLLETIKAGMTANAEAGAPAAGGAGGGKGKRKVIRVKG